MYEFDTFDDKTNRLEKVLKREDIDALCRDL
jgi:hypothetical protein